MTNQLEEHTRRGEKEYAVIGAFEKKEDEFGYYELTLNGLIEVLTVLQDAGFGDKFVGIGYDSDCAYTSINSDEIIFQVSESTVFFKGE